MDGNIQNKGKRTIHNFINTLVTKYELTLAFAGILAFGSSIYRVFSRPGLPKLGRDEAFFEHAGWYITQGAVPYVHIWDIKTHLGYLTTTVLASISFGSMYVLHSLSVILTACVGVGVVFLTGKITHDLTGDRLSSLFAGLTLLTLAGFHYRAALGFRPKYFALLFGLLAIWLQLRKYPFFSGVSMALSAGYAQHAAIFAILSLGLAVQISSIRGIKKTILGASITTIIVLLSIIFWGALEPMIVQTVIAALTTSGPGESVLRRLGRGVVVMRFASIPVLLGVFGIMSAMYENYSKYWWVAAGAVAYGLQLLFIDFDGYPDLFFALAFVSIGVGLLIQKTSANKKSILSASIGIIVVISVVWLGGTGIIASSLTAEEPDGLLRNTAESIQRALMGQSDAKTSEQATDPIVVESPYGGPELERMFWNKIEPTHCHYKLSGKELTWIRNHRIDYTEPTCSGEISVL